MTGAAGLGVVFAGGGTGGHLFPAVAVLEALLAIEPDTRAAFLCSTREIDARILRAQGAAFTPIPAAPLSVHPSGLAKFVRSWGGAVRAARAELRRMQTECGSVRVLSTGGFVAAPVVQAARAEGVPVVLLNQDAPPGKATRWIARHAEKVYTTAEVARDGWERIPPVVRAAAIAPGDAKECKQRLGLDPGRPVLFITGASQGARSVNEFAVAFVRAHAAVLAGGGWQVVHQTGSDDNSGWRDAYEETGVPAVVSQFFDAMGVCWGAADLAVSRSGAGSVAEAWANCVPTVFLPYPYHRDQHQRLNAAPLEKAGGAVVETDLIDPTKNLACVGDRLLGLLGDGDARSAMREAFASLGPVDGAARLAAAILNQ
jgi:UDP-N-acetylglucosamine--N-acetylmuramyl-(pentapeptide) pyrophosphoryl-undecaprenol N-acetylglucosamine transferase